VDRLKDVADSLGAPFCDPAGGDNAYAALFRDTHHHDDEFAAWLTREIAVCLQRQRPR
jgi:hypothetical protein